MAGQDCDISDPRWGRHRSSESTPPPSRPARPQEMAAMVIRAILVYLIALLAIVATSAQAATRTQSPTPFKIYVTIEAERDDQITESIRKLRIQEDRLNQFVDDLKEQGAEWDDPDLMLLQRQLRDIRRRIWRLERDRFN